MLYLILVLAGAVILINGWMYVLQPKMIFYPLRELAATPGDWGYAYRDIQFTAADGVQLHGWYIPHPDAAGTLLFFHGNAGNISHRGESITQFHSLGLNVLIFDYRGYGRSEGRPGEAGLYRDATAAWKYLTETLGQSPQRIVLFGRSLGGAVAAELATQADPAALILESTFTSAQGYARYAFPVLSHVLWLRYRFDTLSKLGRINAPVLVLHSPTDEIIPYHMGRALYRAAAQPKAFVDLRGGHNTGFVETGSRYTQSLQAFIDQTIGAKGSGS